MYILHNLFLYRLIFVNIFKSFLFSEQKPMLRISLYLEKMKKNNEGKETNSIFSFFCFWELQKVVLTLCAVSMYITLTLN